MLAATFDGASVNRRLVKVHDPGTKFVYKVPNVYAEDKRDLFFLSDPLHLIKTSHNCWLSSSISLWVCHTTACVDINKYFISDFYIFVLNFYY